MRTQSFCEIDTNLGSVAHNLKAQNNASDEVILFWLGDPLSGMQNSVLVPRNISKIVNVNMF